MQPRHSDELIEFNGHERLVCEEGDTEDDEFDQEDLMIMRRHQDNRLQQECFDFYHRNDQINDQSLLELEELDSNGCPQQCSEEFRIERNKQRKTEERANSEEFEYQHEMLAKVIEEHTEESSFINQTPSNINPMEATNYQDELNNFIMSRAGKVQP